MHFRTKTTSIHNKLKILLIESFIVLYRLTACDKKMLQHTADLRHPHRVHCWYGWFLLGSAVVFVSRCLLWVYWCAYVCKAEITDPSFTVVMGFIQIWSITRHQMFILVPINTLGIEPGPQLQVVLLVTLLTGLIVPIMLGPCIRQKIISKTRNINCDCTWEDIK